MLLRLEALLGSPQARPPRVTLRGGWQGRRVLSEASGLGQVSPAWLPLGSASPWPDPDTFLGLYLQRVESPFNLDVLLASQA